MKKTTLFLALLFGYLSASNAQTNNIILGRPTDTTITASVMFDQNAQFYLQYGTVSGNYTNTTSVINAISNTPEEVDLKNLLPNTRYYYRMQYKLPSATNFTATLEYNFITKRAAGSSFLRRQPRAALPRRGQDGSGADGGDEAEELVLFGEARRRIAAGLSRLWHDPRHVVSRGEKAIRGDRGRQWAARTRGRRTQRGRGPLCEWAVEI
jgi:hypothetical protein